MLNFVRRFFFFFFAKVSLVLAGGVPPLLCLTSFLRRFLSPLPRVLFIFFSGKDEDEEDEGREAREAMRASMKRASRAEAEYESDVSHGTLLTAKSSLHVV